MNLLSSSSYFHIKNPFSISFIPFKQSLDWASISVKHRGLGVRFHRHRAQLQWMVGYFPRTRGFYVQTRRAEGVWSDPSRSIPNRGPRLDLIYTKPVCDTSARINIQRLEFNEAEISPRPTDLNRTAHMNRRHNQSWTLRSKSNGHDHPEWNGTQILISTVGRQINGWRSTVHRF